MPVPPIVPEHLPPVPRNGARQSTQSPFRRADPARLLRLGQLDADVMSVSLAILAGQQPELFDALVGEAGTYTDASPAAELEPYCRQCGAHAGIFWALGPNWRHYRPGPNPNGRGTAYDAGHPAVIGWRTPADAA